MYAPEVQAKITNWRAKAIAGTITQEEMKEAVRLMREGRLAAANQTKAKKAKAVVDAGAALNDFLS